MPLPAPGSIRLRVGGDAPQPRGFIQPGKPIQNCFVESFNGKFRDECLSENWFVDIPHARRIIEGWRIDYNEVRPHSALENLSPRAFAQRAA